LTALSRRPVEYLDANGMLEDTLIIVTSDHGHSYDVYGTVNVEAFNAAQERYGQACCYWHLRRRGLPHLMVDADGDMFPDKLGTSSCRFLCSRQDRPSRISREDLQVSLTRRSPAIDDENGVTVDNPEDDPNGLLVTSNLPDGLLNSSAHTLQDVPVYAQVDLVQTALRGVNENIEVFFAMVNAIGLDPRQ
jgi:alkaline phosphatase